ncbi:DUF3888 domain-containing protein [Paenactinomyces guangxiensis]|uniref:DUF3888 domain-containing protein n=1 Tax=Paenactinomyces guangxiensis TaxID=1490290 RepID=A0A7W2A6G9_9BACL|nr:DUF3888 domain-containing protein [Paenactinomyces guangxiensis]MBA4493366.1 DUF3888 domain-containing protein [Paenactinomyces guangxiensis]MBH8590456.1 DUF3888 domain-containing protein [Paenactinomyces guangxiensis]
MKKIILIIGLVSLSIMSAPSEIKADSTPQEELLEDTILALLFPEIEKAIEKHFGESKQFFCQDVLKITKKDPGSFLFRITTQVQTFEGAHNPPYHLVTITFDNDGPGWGWNVREFKARQLAPGEKVKCRHPVELPLHYEGNRLDQSRLEPLHSMHKAESVRTGSALCIES